MSRDLLMEWNQSPEQAYQRIIQQMNAIRSRYNDQRSRYRTLMKDGLPVEEDQ